MSGGETDAEAAAGRGAESPGNGPAAAGAGEGGADEGGAAGGRAAGSGAAREAGILLDGVRKSFGDLKVLEGFDLAVREAETVAVIGRSGSGKSVLLKHVAGLIRPDEGRVRVAGRSISDAPDEVLEELRPRIGYVFQFAGLFDSMTVGENIRMALRKRGVPDAEIEPWVERSLELVDLSGQAGRAPAELSGGMRKRAGLARAVAGRPDYLLYDEPTTGLDPVTTSLIGGLIIRLKEEIGATSVLVTHDMESAFRVADRVAMLYRGRVRAVGTPGEIESSEDPVVRAFVEGRVDLWPDDE